MYPTLLVIIAVISLTTALPPSPISSRQAPGGVYVCANTAWKGPCVWNVPTANNNPKGDCIPIPYSLSMSWLSFGPDKNLKCAVYPEADCRGNPMSIRFPGSAHFPAKGAEGASLSYRCVPESTLIAVDPKGCCNPKTDPGCDERNTVGGCDPYSATPVIGS